MNIRWLFILVQTIKTILEWKDLKDLRVAKNLYANTSFGLKLFLSSAYLEILHAYFKIVPSNPVIVFVQVFARFIVIVGFADVFEVV